MSSNGKNRESDRKHQKNKEFSWVDLFCPYCGRMDVTKENGAGDFRLGPEYVCESCGSSFFLR
jgi:transposase-like protein